MKRAAGCLRVLGWMLLMLGVLEGGAALADLTKGPYTFHDNAFADAAFLVNASVMPFGAATSELALTGPDLGSYITDFNDGEIIRLEFTDNWIVNDAGADLVLFEIGVEEAFDVAVYPGDSPSFTSYVQYLPVDIGVVDDAPNNAAAIDLADFGLGPTDVVHKILVRSAALNGSEISGAGALHSLPEPATLALVGAGLAAGVLLRRRA